MTNRNNLDLYELAAALNEKDNDPSSELKLRRGTITAVDRSTNTYSVTVGGATVNDVVAMLAVGANVGDVVDILLDGPSPRIVGVEGAISLFVPTSGLASGWSNGGLYPWAVWRDAAGIVHMEGECTAGVDANPIYTLPALYWPPSRRSFPCLSNGVLAWIGIDSDGTIDSHGAVNGTWFSFNAIHYRGA